MKAILPENLDLKKHLLQYPPQQYGFDKFKFNEDHALYLLSQIILAPAQNQQLLEQMSIENPYTPLYSNYLKAKVDRYKKYLRYFLQTGLIETDNHFIKATDQPGKEKSKGYRFALTYASCKDLTTISYRPRFINVLKKNQKADYLELKPDYNHLLTWLWPVNQLTVDHNAGVRYAKQKRDYLLKNPDKREGEYNKLKRVYQFKDPRMQYKCAVSNLLALSTGNMHISVDDSGRRFHSALTNMQKDNRNLLTYKGEYLTSFDIKNSQPYLITSLFDERMYVNNPKGINIYTINKNLLPYIPADLGNAGRFFENFENSDVTIYKSLVSNVDDNPLDLYLYMKAELEKQEIYYASRDEVKPVMYEVLFTANRYNPDLKKHFGRLFPTVDELLRKFKVVNKKLLPCLLQSIESYLVLQVITKRMNRQYPKAGLFTIHDSIATTEKYADQLKAIMNEELEKFTGLPPKLSKDEWHPSELTKKDWYFKSLI